MTAPVDDQLVERARELARAQSQVPSRNALKTSLRVGSEKAAAVRARLLEESRQRRENSRRAMRRVQTRAPRARLRRALPAGPGVGLAVPVSPGVGPIAPMPEPQVIATPVPAEPAPTELNDGGPDMRPAKVATWPLQLIALPAYVAIWAGWVALGRLTGFGPINLLPGIGPGLTINTAITLPVGAEAYAAYALYVLFHSGAPIRARKFAAWSAAAALLIGMGGQVAYHLMASAGMTVAPWQITTFVSCLPVAVLGAAAALVHLVRAGEAKR